MAAHIGVTYYYILVKFHSSDGSTYWVPQYCKISVNFDHPDGSTSYGYIYYYILVKFHSPDGSTYWVPKNYKILVNFDHPEGSTS